MENCKKFILVTQSLGLPRNLCREIETFSEFLMQKIVVPDEYSIGHGSQITLCYTSTTLFYFSEPTSFTDPAQVAGELAVPQHIPAD